MEDKSILKRIEELSDKEARYEHMKQRYVVIANKLKEAATIIGDVMHEIDPLVNTKPRSNERVRSTRADINEKLEELYKILQVGRTLTFDDVHKMYPNAPEGSLEYVFYNKLGKAPQVLKRSDGHKIVLYMQKEV